jgi:hypothetical protein
MASYLVTGIATHADPEEINRQLGSVPGLAGLRFTIVGSASHRAAGESLRVHSGIFEVISGGSGHPAGESLSGRFGTGVPGMSTSSMTFIEHPTVFDYLRDLDLPYDLAVNYNLAIEAGRSIVVCVVPADSADTVQQAFHDLQFRNVHKIVLKQGEVAAVAG